MVSGKHRGKIKTEHRTKKKHSRKRDELNTERKRTRAAEKTVRREKVLKKFVAFKWRERKSAQQWMNVSAAIEYLAIYKDKRALNLRFPVFVW